MKSNAKANAKTKATAGSVNVLNARPSLPAPNLPPLSQVRSIWNPVLVDQEPKEIFPEWPSSLSAENWFAAETPFVDEAFDTQSFDCAKQVHWKRPSEFLPVIPDPVGAAAPIMELKPPPPSTNSKKIPAAVNAKKEAELPKSKPSPKYAHIFYTDPPATPATPVHLHVEPEVIPPRGKTPVNNLGASPPPAIPLPSWLPTQRRIQRAFRRVWSPEQIIALQKWRIEQDRVEREIQQFEWLMMEYEDKFSAAILNGRLPGKNFQEQEIDPSDLLDEDQQDEEEVYGFAADQALLDVVPPQMEIDPNPIVKPEVPRGDVVDGDLASYLMLIDDILFNMASTGASPGSTQEAQGSSSTPIDTNSPRCLWQSIYPQDAHGMPQYNPGGKYSVRLFCFGKWRKVDIDDRLPVDDEKHITCLSSVMHNEIWPALIAKALYKVLGFFGYSGRKPFSQKGLDAQVHVLSRLQMVISCLTGWKVSRWTPCLSKDNWQEELLGFIPPVPLTSERGEIVPTDAPPEELSPPPPDPNKPLETRVMLCCHSPQGMGTFAFREASLVHEIIGDGHTTSFKFRHPLHGTLTVLSGDTILKDQVSVMMVHLPLKHHDLLTSTWTKIPATETTPIALKPFGNPMLQFVSVKVPPIDDHPKESPDSTVAVVDKPVAVPTDLVLTLTCIPATQKKIPCIAADAGAPGVVVGTNGPSNVPNAQTTTGDTAPANGATEVKKLDSDATVRASPKQILVMRDLRLSVLPDTSTTRPIIAHVSEMCSSRVELSPGHHVFHMFGDTSLQMGYTFQLESLHPVKFMDFATVLREIHALNVVESDGEIPIVRAKSWHVFMKKTIEWVVVDQDTTPSLFIDLHLSDTSVAPLVHLMMVNNDTNEVEQISTLTSVIKLPKTSSSSSRITLIADCSPLDQDVPSVPWHLTLGSAAKLTLEDIATTWTSFRGVYTPNNTLTCFRDVIHVPGEASLSSLQFSLWQQPSLSTEPLVKARHLAAKLEVIDIQTEQVLWQTVSLGETRVWKLPRLSTYSENDEQPRYILQGTIDRVHCNVPSELKSVRPFDFRIGAVDAQVMDSTATAGSIAAIPGACKIQWQLNCWSTEEMRIAPDLAKENRHEAIRRTWAEAAKDRDTNGTLSRLLYLQQIDQFEQQVAQMEDLDPSRLARIQERHDWLVTTLSSIPQFPDAPHGFFRTVPCQDMSKEEMYSQESHAESALAIQHAMEAHQVAMESRKQGRILRKTSQERVVRDFIEQEKRARERKFRKLRSLWLEREAIRKELVES